MAGQKGSPRCGEAGIAQILVVLILLAGLLGGLYLVQKTQVFKPKAFDRPISEPIQICKSRIASFSVYEPCDEVNNGFKSVKYLCLEAQSDSDQNQHTGQVIEPVRDCRTIQDWVSVADRACNSACERPKPIPVPTEPPPCPPWAPYCSSLNTCLFFTKECSDKVITPEYLTPVTPETVTKSHCRQFDGNIDNCNRIPGCAYYSCSSTCWPEGTSNEIACSSINGQ